MPTASEIANEDWLRGRSWDVRLPDGRAATTFDETVYALGASNPRQVAQDLMTLPFGKAAPPEVIAGALEALAAAAPAETAEEKRADEEKRLGGLGSIARRAVGAVAWDPDLHPRDYRGRFIEKGDVVDLPDGRGRGTVVGNDSDGNVVVQDWRGARSTVPAAEVVTAGPAVRAQDTGFREYDPSDGTGADEVLSPVVAEVPAETVVVDAPALTDPRAYSAAKEEMEAAFGERDFARAQRIQRELIAASKAGGFDGKGNRKSDGKPFGTGYEPADPRNDPAYDEYCDDLDARIKAVGREVAKQGHHPGVNKYGEPVEKAGDTQALYDWIQGVENAYRPDRKELHDAIIDALYAKYADVPRGRKVVILAGPSGAGKSTVIKQSGDQFGVERDAKGNPLNYATLNPDDIKEIMAERGMIPSVYAEGGIAENETASFTHEESSHITKVLRARLVNEGVNIIVDGTFAGELDKKRKEVAFYKEAGYTVSGVLVDGDMGTSFRNAALRHQNPPDEIGGRFKGRYVPYTVIGEQSPTGDVSNLFGRPHRSVNSQNWETLLPEFDGGALVFPPGGVGDGTPVWSQPGTEIREVRNVVVSDAVEGKSAEPAFTLPDGTPVYVEEKALEPDISDTPTGGQEGSPEEKAGGADRNRGNAERLRRYWTRGAGAAKIGWGTEGDFSRCVALVSEHMDPERAKGYCNLRHQEAVGAPPGKGHKALPSPSAEPDAEANQNPEPTGVMVALYPPDDVARALAVDGGEDAQELHVTLAFLGTVDDYDEDTLAGLVTAVGEFADDSYEIVGTYNGLGRFLGTDPEEGDPHVALLDAPELPDFRADVVDMVRAAGLDVRTDHGFTPHTTLKYGGDAPDLLAPIPVTFGFLSVAIGGEVWDFPLATADDGESAADEVTTDGDVGDTVSDDESPAPDGAAEAGGDQGDDGAA